MKSQAISSAAPPARQVTRGWSVKTSCRLTSLAA
jgi:hypothetical protein